MELELQVVENNLLWVLGTKSGSSAKAVNTVNL